MCVGMRGSSCFWFIVWGFGIGARADVQASKFTRLEVAQAEELGFEDSGVASFEVPNRELSGVPQTLNPINPIRPRNP